MNDVQEENKKVKTGKEQPTCSYCQQPLKVVQVVNEIIHWVWDEEEQKYVKEDDKYEATDPYCLNCGVRDWDFIDEALF